MNPLMFKLGLVKLYNLVSNVIKVSVCFSVFKNNILKSIILFL